MADENRGSFRSEETGISFSDGKMKSFEAPSSPSGTGQTSSAPASVYLDATDDTEEEKAAREKIKKDKMSPKDKKTVTVLAARLGAECFKKRKCAVVESVDKKCR